MAFLIPVILAGITLVQGVTITLYDATVVGQGDCNDNNILLTCPDIAEAQCCYIPNTLFGSVKFVGLPLPAAQGK
jgi:hypothetical protein